MCVCVRACVCRWTRTHVGDDKKGNRAKDGIGVVLVCVCVCGGGGVRGGCLCVWLCVWWCVGH